MSAHTLSEGGVKKLQERKLLVLYIKLRGYLTFIKEINVATAESDYQDAWVRRFDDNKDGNMIFSHAAGRRGVNSNEPMTLDSVFWIASCTKMIGGIVCMQVVEQGKLSLDG
jgi:hypothetical protein